MAEQSWETTEDEIDRLIPGITMQAESLGLDVTDPGVVAFIRKQAEVAGTLQAGMRWQQNIIHSMNAG